MNTDAMRMFLSEENISKHIAHYRDLCLKLSILEKSEPELSAKPLCELIRMRIDHDIREQAAKLKWSILAHECFFGSFIKNQANNSKKINQGKSRASFIYDIYVEACRREHGFLFVYLNKGVLKTDFDDTLKRAFIKYTPILALDLYEHAYFWDYGFNKDLYLRSALPYLNTDRLNQAVTP